MALTRADVAGIAQRSLGLLGRSLRATPQGSQTEGDFTDALDMTLRDCGLASISAIATQGQERAVIQGATYYVLQRLYRDRAAELTSQQGAGAAGMHLAIDPSTALGSLRLHLGETEKAYQMALSAIGKTMATDPSAGRLSSVVFTDDEDEHTSSLVTGDLAFPWLEEGYTEVR